MGDVVVHFFSVSVYDQGRLVTETRYYFGDCFLKSRRLEIFYPGSGYVGKSNKIMKDVSQVECKQKEIA